MLPRLLWALDEEYQSCGQCASDFSLFHRRHHCRFCGIVFCNVCSNYRMQGARSCGLCLLKHQIEPNKSSKSSKIRTRKIDVERSSFSSFNSCSSSELLDQLDEPPLTQSKTLEALRGMLKTALAVERARATRAQRTKLFHGERMLAKKAKTRRKGKKRRKLEHNTTLQVGNLVLPAEPWP